MNFHTFIHKINACPISLWQCMPDFFVAVDAAFCINIHGGLIEIGKTKVLAYTLERVCRTECFRYIVFL